ncbi:MAG: hypothetical protein RLZZ387_288 [Chloroflexota bacterium]|jgi:signal transduction histidine kinase
MADSSREEPNTISPAQIRTLLSRLLAGDEASAYQILFGMQQAGAPLSLLYDHVLQPVMRAVGDAWERQVLRVDQEHLVTSYCRRIMARLALSTTLAPPSPHAPLLIAACPPGELHDVGLGMLADCSASAGWRVHYLGANVPIAALLSCAAEQRPVVVALSITLTDHLLAARSCIQEIRATYGPGIHILVGGQAVRVDPDIPRALGADSSPQSLDETIELLAELGGNRAALPSATSVPRVEATPADILIEQRLMAAQRATSLSMAASISHELNNPLAVALGEVALLRGERPDDTELHALLDRLDEAHRRMAEIIRFLTNYHLRPPVDREEIPLEVCVERGVMQAQRELREAGAAEGDVAVIVTPVVAWADGGQIAQAVAAVVRNAVEASAGGHIVVVCLSQHTAPHGLGWACIEVCDSGRGMSADEQRLAALPFTSSKSLMRGVGRGLADAEAAIVRHGGHLALSARPGGGIIVRLWLPLTPAPESTDMDHSAALALAQQLEAHAPALEAAVVAKLTQLWPQPPLHGADEWRAGAVRRLHQHVQISLQLGVPRVLVAQWAWAQRVLPRYGVSLAQLADLARSYLAAVEDQIPLREREAAIVRQLAVWLGEGEPPTVSERDSAL